MPEVSNTFVVLMGMGTVFFGLICIIILSMLMSKVCKLFEKESASVPGGAGGTSAEAGAVPAAEPVAIPDRQAMIAAISAAIAEDLGTDISGIRIRSLKQVGGTAAAPAVDRRALVAAVSAAIAEDLGTDVSGIRIRSFKHVGGAAPAAPAADRQAVIAAVSAAIAEDLGTDISGIRIRSFKRVA